MSEIIHVQFGRKPPQPALRPLAYLSVTELRALWDQYDGMNAPDGYAGEDIHLELNLRGDGLYCAV